MYMPPRPPPGSSLSRASRSLRCAAGARVSKIHTYMYVSVCNYIIIIIIVIVVIIIIINIIIIVIIVIIDYIIIIIIIIIISSRPLCLPFPRCDGRIS